MDQYAALNVILYETMLDLHPDGSGSLEMSQRSTAQIRRAIPVVGISGSDHLSCVDEPIRFIGDILNAPKKALGNW